MAREVFRDASMARRPLRSHAQCAYPCASPSIGFGWKRLIAFESSACRLWRVHCAVSEKLQECDPMSQKTVQSLIGQLLTDEELRSRFVRQPLDMLNALRDQGLELTTCEIAALVATDKKLWDAAAARLHPHLQRCALRRE
jgi:hypothetical protein